MARVLLVHADPAVSVAPEPPYAMERVAHALKWSGCQVRMEAPFLEPEPLVALKTGLAGAPDLVVFCVPRIDDGISVDRVDGAADLDTTFFLDQVRELVAEAVGHVGRERVIVCGDAISSGPEVVLAFLRASLAITGPAEDLWWRIGRELAKGRFDLPEDPRVILAGNAVPRARGFGASWRPAPGPTTRMRPFLGLCEARGVRIPVQTSAGCDRRCTYCPEAHFLGFRAAPRPIDEIVAEIDALKRLGVRRFRLAASELNVPDARHAITLLKRLAPLRVDLAAEVQPAPMTDALLDAMILAGLDPARLTFEFGHFDDEILRAGGGPANRASIDRLVETWVKRGFRGLNGVVVIGASPLETDRSVESGIAGATAIDAALTDGLSLAVHAGARVYPETKLARWITSAPESARPDLYGEVDDPTFVRPVVFCRTGSPRALLARWLEGTRSARGSIRSATARAPIDAETEALVNRGIWRMHEDRDADAERCLLAALARAPMHLDALRQLATLCADRLGNTRGAVDALRRLERALPVGDAGRAEVSASLQALGG